MRLRLANFEIAPYFEAGNVAAGNQFSNCDDLLMKSTAKTTWFFMLLHEKRICSGPNGPLVNRLTASGG